MKIRTTLQYAAAAAAILTVAAVPLGAAAAEAPSGGQTIAGYTEDAFVAGAVSQGVDRGVAEAAWGDLDAMARIPVKSESAPGVSVPSLTSRTSLLTQSSGTCWKAWSTVFGEVQRVTLNKQWSYGSNGVSIINPSVQFYGQAGGTYSYDGLIGSNDYYETAYEDPHGKHTSYRQGGFTDGWVGLGNAASATLVSKLGGTYDCSYSGGL